MKNIKIIMHTHWDREWYFTKDETQVLLKNHMYEVIDFLEANKDAIYILDGQSVMIDDLLEIEPLIQDRLQSVIASGQLLVGPWYTQTDLLIVHGESIIRNLYYGIRRALDFGSPMLNGYAPDTFGHNAQMPQIYQDFGIDNTIFWRGFSELKASKSDFVWQGVDGSKIIGINLATGYQGAKYLESDPVDLEIRLKKIMAVLDNYSATDDRLIMNGHDQMPIQTDIYDIIEKLKVIYPEDNISIVNFDSYIESCRKEINNLELVKGELIHSKHARIHKTINSTRMDIKLLNADLEYKIFNVLEPLCVIASRYGIKYPHHLFEKCFKILFGVHAHDSIGGCNSDMVNQDIMQRLLVVEQLVNTEIEQVKRRVSSTYGTFEEGIVCVFNVIPYTCENGLYEVELITRYKDFEILDDSTKLSVTVLNQEVIDAGIIDRQIAARLIDLDVYKTTVLLKLDSIDGLMVKKLNVVKSDNNVHGFSKASKLENSKLSLDIVEGCFVLTDMVSGEVYNNFISLENSCDAGDSYDYSPPVKDLVITAFEVVDVSFISCDSFVQGKYNLKMMIPFNQQSRLEGSNLTAMDFELILTLAANSNKIDAKLNFTNKVCDSRFRIVFNTNKVNDTVICDMQLCTMQKQVYLSEELSVWEKENWAEKPVSIETFQTYVNYNNVSIMSRGTKEYEVVGSNIHLTLMRSFSHLGKRNLVNRPGRPSGIEIKTPDNQLLDTEFNYEFLIVLNEEVNKLANIGHEFVSKTSGYHLKEFNRFNINSNVCLNPALPVKLEFGDLCVSAVKLTENDELLVRFYNPTSEVIRFEYDGFYISNMLEEKLDKMSKIDVGVNEIVTIII